MDVHITGDSSASMGLPVVSGQTSELCPGDLVSTRKPSRVSLAAR